MMSVTEWWMGNGSAGWLWLLDGAVKGFLVLGIAWAVAKLFPRASAATRHLIWTLGVLCVVLAPLFARALPPLRVAVPARVPSADAAPVRASAGSAEVVVTADAAPVAMAVSKDVRAEGAVAPVPRARVIPEVTSGIAADGVVESAEADWPAPWNESSLSIPWGPTLFAVWLGVALFMLAPLGAGALRVMHVERKAVPFRAGHVRDAAAEAARSLGITQHVRLLAGDDDAMPMTWGVFTPVVLLPSSAVMWSRTRLHMVLWHEMAHVARRDALSQLLADVIAAIHWFNPLAWLAAHRMRTERELACDDLVIEAGCKPSAYASELLHIARTLQVRAGTSQAAIAMARTPHLRRRVLAVLDERVTRHRPTRFGVRVATLAALLFVLPVAALETVPADLTDTDSIPGLAQVGSADRAPNVRDATVRGSVASSPDAVRSSAPVIPSREPLDVTPARQSVCTRSENGSSSVSRNDDRWIIHWTGDDCRIDVRIEGVVRYNGDFTAIASLARGGRFELREQIGDRETEIDIRESNGSLRYTWQVNGNERPYDEAGQRWFSSMLLTLFRTTALAAEERVEWMLRTQGPDAVLAEIDHLTRDWARRTYYRELLNQADLPASRVATVLRRAGREIDSDHELTSLLVETVERMQFDADVSRAVIEATATVESDHDHRRALGAVLEKGRLSSQDVAAILGSAESIESDHEKSSLLIDVVERYALEPATRAPYLRVAASIESDHDAGRVFSHLLAQGSLSAEEQAAVLRAATNIQSDHESARLLVGITESALRDETLQTAYLEAAATIGSDHEMGRVLNALTEKHTLDSATLTMLIATSEQIGSDFERARVLINVIDTQRIDGNARQALERAAAGIGSRHERDRVNAALERARQR